MKEPLRQIKVGETFYFFGEKLHYVGTCETGDEPVYVFWSYNKYAKSRIYHAVPLCKLNIHWNYMKKKKD